MKEYIGLESASLSKLEQTMKDGDKNLIIRSAVRIEPKSVKLFLLFGDFESVK